MARDCLEESESIHIYHMVSNILFIIFLLLHVVGLGETQSPSEVHYPPFF
jgi:hypothetical protein